MEVGFFCSLWQQVNLGRLIIHNNPNPSPEMKAFFLMRQSKQMVLVVIQQPLDI